MLLPPPLHPARDKTFASATHLPPLFPAPGAGQPTKRGRRLAFVDIETTGLDPSRHEIIEIGVLLVEPDMELVMQREVRVRPERLEQAEAAALAVCGFNDAAWTHALPLREALMTIAPLLEGALVAGHNVNFDWGFLEAGFRRAGLGLPKVDYHRLDTASLAWPLVAIGAIETMSLDAVCRFLGIDRPRPHRALADARCSLEVVRNMVGRVALGDRVGCLPADEREITDTLLDRLDEGAEVYGEWNVHDGRDYEKEALEEVLDGLHYVAAAIVKRRQERAARRRRVYVCHAFASDPEGNIARVRSISQALIAEGILPIAPHLYLPQLVDEATDREQALALCCELLATCDEVRVFGDIVTEGMERELREAKRLGIHARFFREVQP